MGLLNTNPEVRLNASLALELHPVGGPGLFSQSGALGVAALASAARRGLGLSSFVSAGNRADVSRNDCMQYWEEDASTAVAGLYLESIGNARKFSRIARRLSRTKPDIVVKSGVSGYGVPPGHVVRSSRAPRQALDSMLRQAGVVRVGHMHELFDLARLLLYQPLPAGPRIGIVGNSQGIAVLVADAAISGGLEVGASDTGGRRPGSCHGLTVWPTVTVTGETDAVEAAEHLGWPFVPKTTDHGRRHSGQLGGVVLGIAGPDDLRAHLRAMTQLTGEGTSFVVQQMAPQGVSCVLRDDRGRPVRTHRLLRACR